MVEYFGHIPKDLTYIVLSKILDSDAIVNLLEINVDNKLYKSLLKIRFPNLYNDLQKIIDKVYYRKLKDNIYPVLYQDSFRFAGAELIPDFQNEIEDFSDITLNIVRSDAVYRMYPYLFGNLNDGQIYKSWPVALYHAFLDRDERILIDPKKLSPGPFKRILDFFQTGNTNEEIILDISRDLPRPLDLGLMLVIYICIKLERSDVKFGRETKKFVKHMIDSEFPGAVADFDDDIALSSIYSEFYWHVYNYIIERKRLFGIN